MTGCDELVIAHMPFHAVNIATIVKTAGNRVPKRRLGLSIELALGCIVDCKNIVRRAVGF